MASAIAVDSRVRIKGGKWAGKEGLVRVSNAAKSRVSFMLLGTLREDWIDNTDILVEPCQMVPESRAERLAERIITGILVHGFENDPDVEKLLRAHQVLIASAIRAEIGG